MAGLMFDKGETLLESTPSDPMEQPRKTNMRSTNVTMMEYPIKRAIWR